MRKITIVCCFLLLSLIVGRGAFAQDTAHTLAPKTQDTAKPPVHFYHLDFVVEELGSDGKPVNSRNYSTSVSTDDRGGMSIRTGSKIPIVTGSMEGSGKESQQIQYVDVGVNIDVREAREVGSQLLLLLTVDLTGQAATVEANTRQPVIRQNKWQASILVPVGKPSVAFTSDSVDTKGSTRVVVTATLIQ
jgi:hypothetical protein